MRLCGSVQLQRLATTSAAEAFICARALHHQQQHVNDSLRFNSRQQQQKPRLSELLRRRSSAVRAAANSIGFDNSDSSDDSAAPVAATVTVATSVELQKIARVISVSIHPP
jgi:hypothetical protein